MKLIKILILILFLIISIVKSKRQTHLCSEGAVYNEALDYYAEFYKSGCNSLIASFNGQACKYQMADKGDIFYELVDNEILVMKYQFINKAVDGQIYLVSKNKTINDIKFVIGEDKKSVMVLHNK